jgi:hypothetical protein
MKQIIALFSLLLATVFFNDCSTGAGNMAQMNQMKDSVFAAFPTVAAVTINVQNDNVLLVAIGSQDLYQADAATRQHVADEMAAIAKRIFGEQRKLETGKMMVTHDEMNQSAEPADALISPMDLK